MCQEAKNFDFFALANLCWLFATDPIKNIPCLDPVYTFACSYPQVIERDHLDAVRMKQLTGPRQSIPVMLMPFKLS